MSKIPQRLNTHYTVKLLSDFPQRLTIHCTMKLLSELARLTELRLLLPRYKFLDPWLGLRRVLATHIKIRDFRSPCSKCTPREVADRVVSDRLLAGKKVLDKHHNLHHIVSPKVGNWKWPSVPHRTDFYSTSSLPFPSLLCDIPRRGLRTWYTCNVWRIS